MGLGFSTFIIEHFIIKRYFVILPFPSTHAADELWNEMWFLIKTFHSYWVVRNAESVQREQQHDNSTVIVQPDSHLRELGGAELNNHTRGLRISHLLFSLVINKGAEKYIN